MSAQRIQRFHRLAPAEQIRAAREFEGTPVVLVTHAERAPSYVPATYEGTLVVIAKSAVDRARPVLVVDDIERGTVAVTAYWVAEFRAGGAR